MINLYQIVDYSEIGIPHVVVQGDKFHYIDLFDLIGRQQFMTTFNFREDSDARSEYGNSVLGVIRYEFKILQKLIKSNLDDICSEIIKIDSPESTMCSSKHENLKYGGIRVADIESISFLKYKSESEVHDTGEKVVPNVIEIETDLADIDADKLSQSYLVSKNNSGVELISYEKEQLIGITLGINNDHIDSRILNHFGFDKDSIANNANIWRHAFGVKDRRGRLAYEEKEKYEDINSTYKMEVILKVLNEVKRSNVSANDLNNSGNTLKDVMELCFSFRPHILLHGKKQIYWDIDSYIHIVMRHFGNYQLGDYKLKTPFPYKPKDLKILIEKVINCVESEYKGHVEKRPNSYFSRHGSMAITFNDDHYHLKIEPDGRLSQFHLAGERSLGINNP